MSYQLRRPSIAFIALIFSAAVSGAERPEWHETPDHEITIEVVEQQMKYSPNQFMLTPKSKVKLTSEASKRRMAECLRRVALITP